MLATELTIAQDSIHFRPATILCELAKLFKGYRIVLTSQGKAFPADSILGWTLRCTGMSNPFTLEVEGFSDESDPLAEMALRVMKVSIENLNWIRDAIKLGDKSETPYILFRELHKAISNEVRSIDCNAKEVILFEAEKIFGLLREQKRSKAKAILNSRKGMHVFPSKLLSSVSSLLKSKIILNFVATDGEPSSADVNSAMSLLNASILNGTPIFVNAQGVDCVEAVSIVQYILENVDSVIHPWIEANGPVDTLEDTEKFLTFVKCQVGKQEASQRT